MNVESMFDQLYFCTVRLIVTKPEVDEIATGFFFLGERSKVWLVTNRHVLDGAMRIEVELHLSAGKRDEVALGRTINVIMADPDQGTPWWVGHPDPSVDVACVLMDAVFHEMRSQGVLPYFKRLTKDFLPPDDRLLEAVEEVTLVGYPNGVYDRVNHLPVIRTGVTASHTAVDYCGLPMFLVDAEVFHGASGSPVFIANVGIHYERGVGSTTAPRLLFMGVLAEFERHMIDVEGALHPHPDHPPKVAIPLGLGRVFRASTVEECVSHAATAHPEYWSKFIFTLDGEWPDEVVEELTGIAGG